MASFFSKLFGGGKPEANDDSPAARGETVTYKEFSIAASPMRDGDQWRLCGVILKAVPGTDGQDDVQLERTFIRADLYTSREEAETFAVRKGQQIIDEQGDRLFADGAPTGRA
ncbi:HlyU family transcriptional regulator [Hwanghaeella sp.]|jgi:hypothetical protein|uniref:HlyU family transcriptional regulator n=1 Tax=Hwanghaeella sp. TaxID=2605943 RepID=UPI003CCC42A1